MLCDTAANQIFPVLPNALLEKLGEYYTFAHWCTVDDGHTAVRFCASATTPDSRVEGLIAAIRA